ncbi:MAG: T9SS type A sorting domain-containing protein [Cytophagaceae bacterium]
MKKILPFSFIFLFFSISVYSQRITTIDYDSWTNGTWQRSGRGSYTYDGNGNYIMFLYENYSNGSYSNGSKTEYTRNSAGKISNMTSYQWSQTSSTWTPSSRTTNTYNSSGYLTNAQTEIYSNGTWNNLSRTTYTNNSSGFPTLELSESYYNNAWSNSVRVTKTYNSQNLITNSLTENYINNAWKTNFRTMFTYNGNGKLTNEKHEGWDSNTNSYYNSSQMNYTLNSNGTFNTSIFQIYNSTWVNSSRSIFHYSSVNGIFDISTNSKIFNSFPNPNTGQLYIELDEKLRSAELIILNPGGISVYQSSLTTGISFIDIANFPAGVYYLKVNAEEMQETKMIIKE